MGPHSFTFLCTLVVILLFSTVEGAERAWNGHTTPGSIKPTAFTPYYVPAGARSYDSSSPLLHYSSHWKESFSSQYVQKSIKSTSRSGASMSFTFVGSGIEWFGNTDRRHGISKVFIDGQMVQRVDQWSSSARRQQRLFWVFDLPLAKHTIKIVNTGQHRSGSKGSVIDVDAFVVMKESKTTQSLQPQELPSQQAAKPAGAPFMQNLVVNPTPQSHWTMLQEGTTGVHAMQLSVISETHAIIVDKVEHNLLTISGHPAWAALYNLKTHALKPLNMQSNSFCAGGTFLGNGTLINVGGNPVVDDITNAADFGDVDGLQAIRIFEPCDSEDVDNCDMYENHSRIRMASPRWYNTVLRISDGSAMIIGGSKKGGWINNQTTNNPTIEYFPPKFGGLPIQLDFLLYTMNSNLFPIAISLPDERVFMAANRDAMIYNWKTNTEVKLPQIPNGVRVTYPMTGTGILLPLTPENGYTPEVLICGGSAVDDTKADYEISSQDPASAQCSRIILSDNGIAAGWQVEQMPEARIMPDAVLLPTGQVLIANGAKTGISGYGNVADQVGASNADNPVFTPVLYDPRAPVGQRFSSVGMPTSDIPRLYHSVATLTPEGNIMVAGSNPNLDRSETKYGTEYRVEWINPPYMNMARPALVEGSARPKKIDFFQDFQLQVDLPQNAQDIRVVLMDLGYVTHAVHSNSRLVHLPSSLDGNTLTVTGPPNAGIYPPGPGFIYIVVGGVPSVGMKVMIGDGQGPKVDKDALDNMLTKTKVDQNESDS
ncbi:unnamed protein product [Somion occarium]|uniref:Copper radical oxidase n=2 Tax=Somion occarium TaxID=3059160 RepID=A0ABP1DB82_9APHY